LARPRDPGKISGMRRFRRLGLPILLSTLAVVTAGCDSVAEPAPSSWTPRPAPTVWPSTTDLAHYLPADDDLTGTGLTRGGPPVSQPRPALLRVCDVAQPWDALVKQGAALTWRAGDGREIRQVITTYGRISGRDVLEGIQAALRSCWNRFTYEGTRFRTSAGVGISAADAAEAYDVTYAEPDSDQLPRRCFILLASHDRLTQLTFTEPGKDFQGNLLTTVAGAFAVAVSRT
jgi:hypothetical protein